MKNIRFIILLVVVSLKSFAYSKDFQFQLEKHQKAIRTFSGDIDQGASVHLIIFKDKSQKNYGIKPFYIDKNDELIELNIISLPEAPSIVSYHQNNNILSLIIKTSRLVDPVNNSNSKKPGSVNGSFREKIHTISMVDINLANKKTTTSVLIRDTSTLEQDYYGQFDHTLSISKSEDTLRIKKIKNSSDIDSLTVKFEEEDKELAKDFFSGSFQFVATNEYVKNGSISNAKFYYKNNTLIYTKFDEKEEELVTAIIHLDQDKKPLIKIIELKEAYKVQWASIATYIYNNDLFIFCRTPNDMYLDIINLYNGSSVYHKNLKKDLGDYLDLQKLNSLKSKLSHEINKPTITVNKTVDSNMVIRLDYVKTQNYYYDHNNFFWMHQQMMFQNQMNFRPPPNPFGPGFGPSDPNINFNEAFLTTKKKELSQKIVLSPSYTIIKDGNTKPEKPKIEKGKFIASMDKMRAAKFLTYSFSKKYIRYIFYSKQFDGFVIKTSPYPK